MQHTDSRNWKSSSLHVIIQNQLKDRSVIQLYVKATGVYLGLKTIGGVVGITNPDSDLSKYYKTRLIIRNTLTHLTLHHSTAHLIFCDRGLGRVSLTSVRGMFKIKMRFNGNLVCQVRPFIRQKHMYVCLNAQMHVLCI